MTQAEHSAGLAAEWRHWWDYERGRLLGGGPVARINQIRRRSNVLYELIARGLKVQYRESFLGYAWSLLEPALLVVVYWLVFGRVARFGMPHYPLFIASAIMPWMFFNGTLSQAANSLRSNSGLVRTVTLPREIYPLAAVGEQGAEYLFSLPVVFLVGALYGVMPSRYVLMLPLVIVVEVILVTGLGLMLAALNALLRDVSKILRVSLRVLFYLSPVLYPSTRLHGVGAKLFQLNPLVGILQLNRAVWYPTQIPAGTLMSQFMISIAGALVFLVFGWWTFITLERHVLKEL
ncbi:MAG TPA: ABC transporter permease [Mycobacteriales bacterium]|nr:ABC transporter permease [Mycobacteriales bacterium]